MRRWVWIPIVFAGACFLVVLFWNRGISPAGRARVATPAKQGNSIASQKAGSPPVTQDEASSEYRRFGSTALPEQMSPSAQNGSSASQLLGPETGKETLLAGAPVSKPPFAQETPPALQDLQPATGQKQKLPAAPYLQSYVSPAFTYTVSMEPVVPSKLSKLIHGLSPKKIRHFSQPDNHFEPPKVMRQTRLSLPVETERTIRKPILFDLRLSINKSGKVVRGDTTTRKVPLALRKAALLATRQWIFAPARLGTSPIAAQVLLHFRISSSTR